MTKVYIDPIENKIISHAEAAARSSIVGFCSWSRLTNVFEAADELHEGEKIVAFAIDEQGLTLLVTRKL